MTTKLLFFGSMAVALFAAPLAWSQPVNVGGVLVEDLPLGARNGTSNMHAEGGRLYAGPKLVISDDGQSFSFADDDALEPTASGRVTIYSIDVEGDVIWIGLGFNDVDSDGSPQTAAGFAFSTDAGQTWTYRFPQLDAQDDTVQTYGVSMLEALPVIVPQQSPPFDVDYDQVTGDVWMAGWASGVRKSSDMGATWDRIVLPPDTLDSIDPQTTYTFEYAPIRGGVQQNGFLGFSVLVDEGETVWAGTAAGVSRSDPSDIDPVSGDRAWRRFYLNGTGSSLAGDFVTSIEEQPLGDPSMPVGDPANPRNPVWIIGWPSDSGGENGLTVWLGDDENGDPVFETRLSPANRIYDTAFNGETIYVAGLDGLFVSEDEGITWRTINTFRNAGGEVIPLGPEVGVFSVAVTNPGTQDATIWAGADSAILKSTDGGQSWVAFRVNVPVNPQSPTEAVPDVESYAYPNPFTPAVDGYCRIRFDLANSASTASVRIFDFGMNLVREFDSPVASGSNEVLWDGLSGDGTRVANGVYFYVLEAGSMELDGKIMVLE